MQCVFDDKTVFVGEGTDNFDEIFEPRPSSSSPTSIPKRKGRDMKRKF